MVAKNNYYWVQLRVQTWTALFLLGISTFVRF